MSEEPHIKMNGEPENAPKEPEPLVNGDLGEDLLGEDLVTKQGTEKSY
jgi:hypothetical protein